MPSVVGQTVADASATASGVGLRAVVQDGSGDSDLPGALVIAQEPPPGVTVPVGSVVGLRTALPDTEETQECPGTSHPHSEPGSADGLPMVEQIERSAVDAIWLDSGPELNGAPLVLGVWDRYAYELGQAGGPSIIRTEGFQLMALYESAEDCPATVPLFIGGAPVTRVILDRTDFARDSTAPEDRSADDPWTTLPSGPADLRTGMTVAWTGDEVLVVGGLDYRFGAGPDGVVDGHNVEYGDDGEISEQTPMYESRSRAAAAFDPDAGRWRQLADLPFEPYSIEASSWSGSELLMLVDQVTGSTVNGPTTEKRLLLLDPEADQWQVRDVPDDLRGYYWTLASGFTGTEWLLWGYRYHEPDSEPAAVAYDPAGDRWRSIDRGPLSFRELPGAAWTGDEFVVFGGDAESSYDVGDPPSGDAAAYDPDTDTWRELPSPPVPNLRDPSVVWTGTEVLIWGGSFGPSNPTQGAAYDPAADSWRSLAPSPLYGRNDATAVWTGDRLVVTDGTASYASPDSGAGSATYDPRSDVWKVISDPPGGLACNSSGVGTPFGLYLFGGSVGCTAITTPREAVLHLEPPR